MKIFVVDFFPKAAPQDFDDLVPIFNSQSKVLHERFGGDEFFLAELIESEFVSGIFFRLLRCKLNLL